MKLNFGGSGGVKNLLLAHGEKVVVVAVGALVGWMIFGGMSIEKIDPNKPEKLKTLATAAQQNILNSDPTQVSLSAAPPVDRMRTVNPDVWTIDSTLNPMIHKPSTKRADPELFTAEKLEVTSGFDPLAMVDPRALAAGADVEKKEDIVKKILEQKEDAENPNRRMVQSGRRGGVPFPAGGQLEFKPYVTVLAKVPAQRQRQAFDKAFQNSEMYDPATDMPDWVGYIIQRADVTDGGEPRWENVPGFRGGVVKSEILVRETARYAGLNQMPPVIHPNYRHDILTWPLLPLLGRDLGPEARHSEIPALPTPEEMALEQQKNMAEQMKPAENRAEEGPDGFGSGQDNPLGPRGVGGARGIRGGYPGARGRSNLGAMGGRGMMGMEGDEGGYPGMGMMGGGMGRGGMGRVGMGGYAGMVTGDAPYYMLRFFDLTVQSGHRYRYRVRLALRDPNYQIPARYLTPEAAELDKRNWVKMSDDWSEPSPVVTAPYSGRMLAGNAEAPSSRPNSEPEITVVVKSFDPAKTAEAATEQTGLRRGSVGNVTGKIGLSDLAKGEIDESDEDYQLQTDLTIVDILGGRKLGSSSDFTEPAEMLVLTPNGRLLVQSELDDGLEYEDYIMNFKEPDETMMDGRGGGPRNMRGMEGGGRSFIGE